MDKKTSQSSYKYEPLEHPQSVRLITLCPGARRLVQKSDSIQCELWHARLDQDPRHEALSYVWGNSSDQEFI